MSRAIIPRDCLSPRALVLSRDISVICTRVLGSYPSIADDYDSYYDACSELQVAICHRDLKLHACIRLLLERRYIAEAGILLLAQLESSVYLLHVGRDSKRAREWLDHKKTRAAPDPGVRRRLEAVFQDCKPVLEHYKSLYEQLSMIKHANPYTLTDPNFRLFSSPRVPLPNARLLKDEKRRFIYLLDANFDGERIHAHWIIGESCELLMKIFDRFIEWHRGDILAQKGGPALLQCWKRLCRRWARVRIPGW